MSPKAIDLPFKPVIVRVKWARRNLNFLFSGGIVAGGFFCFDFPAESMDGEIKMESEIGKGSVMILRFTESNVS
ncbi:hypothetical protein ANAEL_04004 [Anaerolineales bacterium]|nr:hypothetical protein ANAEL_04004 [Anaerolineales bacterium]